METGKRICLTHFGRIPEKILKRLGSGKRERERVFERNRFWVGFCGEWQHCALTLLRFISRRLCVAAQIWSASRFISHLSIFYLCRFIITWLAPTTFVHTLRLSSVLFLCLLILYRVRALHCWPLVASECVQRFRISNPSSVRRQRNDFFHSANEWASGENTIKFNRHSRRPTSSSIFHFFQTVSAGIGVESNQRRRRRGKKNNSNVG